MSLCSVLANWNLSTISDTCKDLGAYFTYCINIEGATGCKSIPQRRPKSLEECKQGCIAYTGEGTCVLASLHKETLRAERGICHFLVKMNTPDMYLNVCKVDSGTSTTAMCTVGKL